MGVFFLAISSILSWLHGELLMTVEVMDLGEGI